MTVECIKQVKAFDGYIKTYQHDSETTKTRMTFAVFEPPQAVEGAQLPVLYWLSGLTCTHENFIVKSGALRKAAELGFVLVSPDTSPRDTSIPGEDDEYDFGSGASFYVNATQAPWSRHYQMYDYIVSELPEVIEQVTPVDHHKCSIFGHSMGGHGALVIGLRNPERYHSISAFAPMTSPLKCQWGHKAFSRYLGDDQTLWQAYDASYLIEHADNPQPILVDQGDADGFLHDQLFPEMLQQAAKHSGAPLKLRMRPGYDHSYFFIATFIDQHLMFHADKLGIKQPSAIS